MNSINWTIKATKQLRKLDRQVQAPIVAAVSNLVAMPNCQNVKALTNHEFGYRLRVGNYRVLFDWHNELRIIKIEEVRKRDERTY
jgi:mRNA interferase RelE/StbE